MHLRVVILLVLSLLAIVTLGQEYEDNDFAEFEEFGEDTEEDDEGKVTEDVVENKNTPTEDSEPSETVSHGTPEPMDNSEDDFGQDDDDEDEAHVEDEEADEFSHFNDNDEFEGYNNDLPRGSRPKTQSEPKITIAKVPLHLRSNWDSFYLEMLMIAGLIVYFVNFMIGKSKNQKLAQSWFNSHLDLLQNNFSLVGDDGKPAIETSGLQKESENVYTLWCSGRSRVEGMLVELKFLKRQDLIGVVSQLIRPSSDQLHIKVHLEDMDSFVFALATKKTAARLSKDMNDINTYCPEKKTADKYGLTSQLVILNEIGEVASAVLGDPKVTAVLNKYTSLFDFLHFSDQYSGAKQQDDSQPTKLPEVSKTLLFGFNFPGQGNPSIESIEGMRPLLQLVLHITDKLRQLRLSKEGKTKAEKNRARVEEAFLKATHAARAEMAQAKREEKKRVERERMLEIDDPDKQRKWEEREQRRQMKRRAPKMKQLKVS